MRKFNYDEITLKDIEDNEDKIFICDGDTKEIEIERNENE